jgi:hypothetical protein
MVDQPRSPPAPRPRITGKLTLPPVDAGMNKTKPNNAGIKGRGDKVGPDIDADIDKKLGERAGDEKILERMRKRMERGIAAEADNRKAAVDDRKFKAGEQWPADVATQRNTDKRPCLTNNRMKTFVHQVVNPLRENRPSINISPVGGKSDKLGAAMFKGMIRSIERDSHADIAYDTALDDAVTSGWGYFRLLTEWKSEESFCQVLRIKRIRNPFTVYLDPDCQEPDGADARFGFITEMIPEDVFKEDYPKAQFIPWDVGGTGEKYKSWTSKDGIRVAEYYEVEEEPADYVQLSTGWEGWKDDMGEVLQRMVRDGRADILQQRKSHKRKVMYYKATAVQILERTEWIGKWVPLIKVVGDEIDIEGKVKYSGIIRDAKDAQRMDNYWATFLTENVALAPKTHYIMEEGQMEGHEQEWKNANIRPRPAITYKGTSVDGNMAPPPQRIPAPEAPAGILAAMAASQQNMMATTGIRFDSTPQERMFDESGKAIRELGRRTDVGAFHYYDNFRRSLEFLGKQLVDAIPKVYDEKQIITILRDDDKDEAVTIDPMLGRPSQEVRTQTGVMRYFNPAFGEYGVTVDIGPSYATKRQEAAESMMDFVKHLPNTAQLVMDLIANEMDWPGAEKIAARLAKAIPPQMLTPEMKDVPPQVQALVQNLERQSKQLQLQLQAAVKELNDKNADRDIDREKIASDYEAKLLSFLIKSEDTAKKLAMEQARFTAETIITEMRTHSDRQHEMHMAMISAPQPKTDKKEDA